MKSWNVSEEIRQNPALLKAVEESRAQLEEAIGASSTGLVDASWTIEKVGLRQKLRLTLSDWTRPDGVRSVFEPDELSSERLSRRKFNRLWSDLLKERNHEQLRQIQEYIAE